MEVDIRGAKLFVKEQGQGDLLVLVHGTGATADLFDGVLPTLGRGHRVVAYDRRGWLRSGGKIPQRRGLNQSHGQDLLELIRCLQAGPATVVATSAGCFYAIHAALESPTSIARLVLHEPPLHAAKHVTAAMFRVFAKVTALRLLGRKKAAMHTFIRSLLTGCHGRDSFAVLPASYRQSLDETVDAFWTEAGAGSGEELTSQVLRNDLRVPMAFMLGACAAPPFQQAMQRLTSMCKGVPVIDIPEGNHVAMIERPEAFCAAIEQAIAAAVLPAG